jgi:hypothetical protein
MVFIIDMFKMKNFKLKNFQSLIFFLTNFIIHVNSLTNGVDVYENIQLCAKNRAGPNCNIPYVTCPDNKRRCFNNAKCIKEKDSFTENYTYNCECPAASPNPNPNPKRFAGVECEHSETVTCSRVQDEYGSKFCTNGGQCFDMMINGELRGGCSCAYDFIGAQCQYLREDVPGGLVDEALFEDVATNFWAFNSKRTNSSNSDKSIGAAIGVAISAIAMISLAFGYTVFRRKQIVKYNQERVSVMFPTNLDPDGSNTMINDGVL